MEKYKPYYQALNGTPHFKDEMPEVTHHGVELLVADGKCHIEQTLFDNPPRELVVCNFKKEEVKIIKK